MFDSVGRQIDAEAGKRRIAALLATFGASAGVMGLSLAFVAWRAATIVIEVLPTDTDMPPLVEIVTDEIDDLGSLPPPPAALGMATKAVAEPAPEAVEPTEPVPLPPEVANAVTASAPGTADGSEVGTADGEGNGPGPGTQGGTGDGFGGRGDGVRTIHHTEVTPRHQVQPLYPRAAEGLGLGDVSCRAEVSIDEDGVPYDVAVTGCPLMFEESARRALLQWRWSPARAEGRPVKAKFLMRLDYLESEEN